MTKTPDRHTLSHPEIRLNDLCHDRALPAVALPVHCNTHWHPLPDIIQHTRRSLFTPTHTTHRKTVFHYTTPHNRAQITQHIIRAQHTLHARTQKHTHTSLTDMHTYPGFYTILYLSNITKATEQHRQKFHLLPTSLYHHRYHNKILVIKQHLPSTNRSTPHYTLQSQFFKHVHLVQNTSRHKTAHTVKHDIKAT